MGGEGRSKWKSYLDGHPNRAAWVFSAFMLGNMVLVCEPRRDGPTRYIANHTEE